MAPRAKQKIIFTDKLIETQSVKLIESDEFV